MRYGPILLLEYETHNFYEYRVIHMMIHECSQLYLGHKLPKISLSISSISVFHKLPYGDLTELMQTKPYPLTTENYIFKEVLNGTKLN